MELLYISPFSSIHIRLSGSDRPAMIAYLYGPMLAMIIANVFMFVWLVVVFYNLSSIAHASQRYEPK